MIQISGPEWYEHQKVASDCKSVSKYRWKASWNECLCCICICFDTCTVTGGSVCLSVENNCFHVHVFYLKCVFSDRFSFWIHQTSVWFTILKHHALNPGQNQILASRFLPMVGGGPFNLHEGLMNVNHACNCGKLRFKNKHDVSSWTKLPLSCGFVV